ncbi:NAD-dependent epimerase/dehydratase family protein [Kitasatospora sp. NPDC058190]|uniref:NAD-dependent epimerase/dehydratase family protein n=1 Tax=Kitasatospora sp. NPDC058190 TaxID=3346371 RepID=UPI0036DA52F7
MEIIGRGFIARNLEPLATSHPDALILAAGVSSTAGTSVVEFRREAELLESALAKAIVDGRRLVFFSTASSGVYGALGCGGREDEPVVPSTPYAAHKLRLEETVRRSGADHLILRLSHLVGEHQRGHQLIPALVAQIRAGVVQVRSGASRDLLDVADMVRILDVLLAAGVSRQVVNVASGHPVPIEAILDHLELALGLRATREVTESTPGNGYVSTERLSRLLPDISELGFGPDYYRRVIDARLLAGLVEREAQ